MPTECHSTKHLTSNPQNRQDQGFPGSSVGKPPPANAGDRGLLPDPGRSHTLRLSSGAWEPHPLRPGSTVREATARRSLRAAAGETPCSSGDPAQPETIGESHGKKQHCRGHEKQSLKKRSRLQEAHRDVTASCNVEP